MLVGAKKRNAVKVEMGDGAQPVIFTHVGVGDKVADIEQAIDAEIEKAKVALSLGAHIICDVSLCKNINYVQQRLMQAVNAPVASVAIYETYLALENFAGEVDDRFFIEMLKGVIERGADVITLHATVFRADEQLIEASSRVIPTTSRGGVMMLELMKRYNMENPYYTCFDEILGLCADSGVSISLGPTYRPASVVDCDMDDLHLTELERMGKLCKKAMDAGVNIMVEGIGHAPLNMIERMVKETKRICYGAPYRCMAVATDIAIGFDHVSSAIAHANAIYHGADSVTVVTRSEHLGIPSLEDVKEGVMSAVVAVRSGYSARENDFERDEMMSRSRKNDGCVGDIGVTLFPEQVENYLSCNGENCTMCGDYCPLRARKEI